MGYELVLSQRVLIRVRVSGRDLPQSPPVCSLGYVRLADPRSTGGHTLSIAGLRNCLKFSSRFCRTFLDLSGPVFRRRHRAVSTLTLLVRFRVYSSTRAIVNASLVGLFRTFLDPLRVIVRASNARFVSARDDVHLARERGSSGIRMLTAKGVNPCWEVNLLALAPLNYASLFPVLVFSLPPNGKPVPESGF